MSDKILEIDLTISEDENEIDMDFETKEESIDLEVEIPTGGTNDYNDLLNKPKLNGQTIQGEMNEIDPTVPDWAKDENKPKYRPEEIGAVDVDNEITFAEIDEMFKTVFGY